MTRSILCVNTTHSACHVHFRILDPGATAASILHIRPHLRYQAVRLHCYSKKHEHIRSLTCTQSSPSSSSQTLCTYLDEFRWTPIRCDGFRRSPAMLILRGTLVHNVDLWLPYDILSLNYQHRLLCTYISKELANSKFYTSQLQL